MSTVAGARSAAPAPLWHTVFLIDVVAAVVVLLPALSLAVGIQAIGAYNGCWIGDPNSDDGEESFATILGLLGVVPVLSGMSFAVARSAARREKGAWLLNVMNTVGFVAFFTVLGIWAFQPAPLHP